MTAIAIFFGARHGVGQPRHPSTPVAGEFREQTVHSATEAREWIGVHCRTSIRSRSASEAVRNASHTRSNAIPRRTTEIATLSAMLME
jgi:hypothetical protein